MKAERAAIPVQVPWEDETHYMADHVFAADRPTHSKLLGPDGRPLMYETHRMGFDLTHVDKRRK